MKLTLVLFLFAFVVTYPAIAQCPGLPACWPWYAEQVQCSYNGQSGCSAAGNCITRYANWANFDVTYYDPSLGQFDSCTTQLVQCTDSCGGDGCPLSVASKTPVPWRFDPVKIVMGLFPRVHVDIAATGRSGRCVRVVHRKV